MGPALQRLLHEPQLAGPERLASHPLTATKSQLPKPGAQVSPHTPMVQVAPAFWPLGHGLRQEPQVAGSERLASQPFIGLRSQSAKPGAH